MAEYLYHKSSELLWTDIRNFCDHDNILLCEQDYDTTALIHKSWMNMCSVQLSTYYNTNNHATHLFVETHVLRKYKLLHRFLDYFFIVMLLVAVVVLFKTPNWFAGAFVVTFVLLRLFTLRFYSKPHKSIYLILSRFLTNDLYKPDRIIQPLSVKLDTQADRYFFSFSLEAIPKPQF